MIRRVAARLRAHLLGLFADADVTGSCCPIEHDDVMDVAEAVEVTSGELAGMCERDLIAYRRMRETADHSGVGLPLLATMLDFALAERWGPTQYADACDAITDELLAEISEAKREADRIDSAALHLELDTYATEER